MILTNKVVSLFSLLLMIASLSYAGEVKDGIYSIRFRAYDYERHNICIKDQAYSIKLGLDTIINWADTKWQISFSKELNKSKSDSENFKLKVTCLSDNVNQVSVSLEWQQYNWDAKNFVLMPGAVYNGNKFLARKIPYSPRILLPQDAGLDAPIVISDVPRLNLEEGFSRIQERSGGMSFPCIAFLDTLNNRSRFLIAEQGNELGDYGFEIEENRSRAVAYLRVSSPLVRELHRYSIGNTHTPSYDKGHVFKKGESIQIKAQLYTLPASNIKSFYQNYFNIHQQVLKTAQPVRLDLPLSKAYSLIEKKYNQFNWNANQQFYGIDSHTGNKKWKPGWVGGQITAYALTFGADTTRNRIIKENNWFFPAGISPSGFFYERCEDGIKWISGDPSKFHTKNWHLIRSSSDALYYTFKQLELLKKDKSIPQNDFNKWVKGAKTVSDAFVRNWKRYGQWGQFVDSENGVIVVGGSASAAITPAALVYASSWFADTVYLNVAKQSARYYYQEFIKKGITTGGPGDALQSPDSESCFGLIESFMTLYDCTKEKEWITYAEETVNQFSTWVMPYSFQFPKGTLMHQLGVSTVGTVWANVQNKHAAPGICTASGLALLKLYQVTKKEEYLLLLKLITQSALQYVSHPDKPIAKQPFGFVDERISTTDWYEGIGEIEGLSTWAEVAILLMGAELPSVFIDQNRLYVFDHVEAELQTTAGKGVLEIRNPTNYEAKVKISIGQLKSNEILPYQTIELKPKEKIRYQLHKKGWLIKMN
ncbi:hypothetical protein [Pedobacter puniceum]|uniref:Alpha-L-rhamnosidase six-hairpin glycosidase domain-containing protein n=1 Tax=Pedobacter puniceum TaxID=2666136 RepID=A0A7K0FNC8_9SPHI|nr:hypothetical protein [Pedobacter puniceum]MRX46925.1 hypothetical protein [Pedobacter puniceum]